MTEKNGNGVGSTFVFSDVTILVLSAFLWLLFTYIMAATAPKEGGILQGFHIAFAVLGMISFVVLSTIALAKRYGDRYD